MSLINTPNSPRSSSSDSDIYTVLMVVAFLFTLIATIYIGFRAQTLFGSLIPPGGS